MGTFTKLRALLGDVSAQYQGLLKEREGLLQERELLHILPLPKSDVISHIGKLIDEGADDYSRRLKLQIEGTIFPGSALKVPGRFPVLAPWVGEGAATVLGSSMYALFNTQLKDGVSKIIHGMDWPECGAPLEERLVSLESIEKKLAEGRSAQIPLNPEVKADVRVQTPQTIKAMQVDFEAAAAQEVPR